MEDRDHSLVVPKLADGLVCTAKSEDGIIMGVRHKEYPIEGVQLHPESVLTPNGVRMVGNFLDSFGCFVEERRNLRFYYGNRQKT